MFVILLRKFQTEYILILYIMLKIKNIYQQSSVPYRMVRIPCKLQKIMCTINHQRSQTKQSYTK